MIRGEVVRLKAPRRARGSEQRGARYGVIVQADDLLDLSTIVVAPTSTRAQTSSFRPEVMVRGQPTLVLVDQLTAMALERLEDTQGLLTHDELRAVDSALILFLGLAD